MRRGGAEEADHEALDEELGGGEEVGVAGVGGAEEGAAALHEEVFEGGLAVDEGGDDLAWAGVAGGEEDGVAVENVGVDHGVAAHAQGKQGDAGREAVGGGIDGEDRIGFLFGGGGGASGNGTVEGDVAERMGGAGEGGGGGEGAGFAGVAVEHAFSGEGGEVAGDGEGAGETEVGLDLANGGENAGLVALALHEVEHGLLAGRKHSVQMNTQRPAAQE